MVPVGVADHSIQNRVFGDSDPGFPRGLAASELVVQRLPYVRQRVARVAKRSLGTVVVDRDLSRRCERVRTESESSVLRLLLVERVLPSRSLLQLQAEVSRYVNVTAGSPPRMHTGENVRPCSPVPRRWTIEHQRHPDAVSGGLRQTSGSNRTGPAGTISATSWASVRSSRNRSASEEVSLRIAKPSSSRSHGSRLAAVTRQSPR